MSCSPKMITHGRNIICAVAAAWLTVWAIQSAHSASQPNWPGPAARVTSLTQRDALSFAVPAVAEQCPTLPAPSSMSGSTELNTVKSQMWIIDGVWWGAFSNSGLYFYKRSGTGFTKGALIDSSDGRPDTLWNGSNLFILIYKSSSQATLYKYTYSSATQTYSKLSGFPVNLSLSSASAITFAQDSNGKLWAAYTGSGLTRAIWSTSADHTVWNTAGFALASGIPSSEIAAIVAFGGNKIGVAWSNQAVGEDGFRYHIDGDAETTWSGKELIDCCKFSPGGVADDHMNIKAAPDGRIFLVAKDSNLNANGTGNGNLHLYVRSTAGVWAPGVLVNPDPSAEPTRPSLLLDTENNEVYVVYVDSHIDKSMFSHTSMDNPLFGPACVFIDVKANNSTSTKQNLNSSTDLIAAGSINGQILSNVIDLQPAQTSGLTISSLSPASATAGGAAFTLTVNGSGFVNASQVQWNNAPRNTTSVSATQLTADIFDTDIAAPGSADVTVVNPALNVATSNTKSFLINSPTPTPTPPPIPTPTPTPSPTPTPAPTPTQTTLAPQADAYVKSGDGAINFGTSTQLRARLSKLESYLKFDLSSLGAGSISNAKLRLYGQLKDNTSTNIPTAAYSVSGTTWTETGITWNNKPAAGTTALATVTVTNNVGRVYEWDITAFIKSEKSAGRNVVSIALKNPLTSTPYAIFNSKEATSNRPQLVLTVTSPGIMPTARLSGAAVSRPELARLTFTEPLRMLTEPQFSASFTANANSIDGNYSRAGNTPRVKALLMPSIARRAPLRLPSNHRLAQPASLAMLETRRWNSPTTSFRAGPMFPALLAEMLKNKHDPRNHTKQHEMDELIRVISCDLVDRFTAPT